MAKWIFSPTKNHLFSDKIFAMGLFLFPRFFFIVNPQLYEEKWAKSLKVIRIQIYWNRIEPAAHTNEHNESSHHQLFNAFYAHSRLPETFSSLRIFCVFLCLCKPNAPKPEIFTLEPNEDDAIWILKFVCLCFDCVRASERTNERCILRVVKVCIFCVLNDCAPKLIFQNVQMDFWSFCFFHHRLLLKPETTNCIEWCKSENAIYLPTTAMLMDPANETNTICMSVRFLVWFFVSWFVQLWIGVTGESCLIYQVLNILRADERW